jgi:ATP-dependent exoDNAse (exonuclease V) beta subunit
MVVGSNWPRKEYMFPDGTPYTAEDIERQWDRSREYSMNYGTWMHYNIERHFNCLKPSEKLVEMSQFYNFEKLWIVDQNVTPLRTEWKIAAPEWSLGGTIDFVGKKADGSYVIMDWKRSLKLDQNLTNNFNKKGRPPLEHIDDCEGSKYFLQLNLYKRILEKKYNINVSSMVLVSFHQKLEHYLAVDVPVSSWVLFVFVFY